MTGGSGLVLPLLSFLGLSRFVRDFPDFAKSTACASPAYSLDLGCPWATLGSRPCLSKLLQKGKLAPKLSMVAELVLLHSMLAVVHL